MLKTTVLFTMFSLQLVAQREAPEHLPNKEVLKDHKISLVTISKVRPAHDNGVLFDHTWKLEKFYYDTVGNTVRYEYYMNNGWINKPDSFVVFEESNYKYDTYDSLVEHDFIRHNKKNFVTGNKINYIYTLRNEDSVHLHKVDSSYWSDGLSWRSSSSSFSYYQQGILSKDSIIRKHELEKGCYTFVIEYFYSDKGRVSKTNSSFYRNGEISYSESNRAYFYDQESRLIKKTRDGRVVAKWIYDDEAHTVEYIRRGTSGKNVYISTYDDNNRLIKYRVKLKEHLGKKEQEYTYEYNAEGLIQKITYTNLKTDFQSTSNFEYETFDM